MRCLLAVILLVMSATPASAKVPDALREELRSLAQDVAKIIEKKGGGGVAIGEFTGSVDVIGHSGPRIQMTLAEEFEAAHITVDDRNHRFEISGRYQPFLDSSLNREKAGGHAADATNLNAIKLVAFLIDRETGEPLAERPTGRLIFGSETVPSMLGLNTSYPPLHDPRELSKAFSEAQKSPHANVNGSLIQDKLGNFAIEVLVRRNGHYVPQPASPDRGHPFVELNESEIYGVRLINNSSNEVAVDLRIDGINTFAFSNSTSNYWIIKPHGKVDVIGWHRDEKTSTEFKVVSNFPETAAAKLHLKPSAKIGLITAAFSASWNEESQRPGDEPLVQGRGTGFGDDIEFGTVHLPRTIGQVRSVLSVRYER